MEQIVAFSHYRSMRFVARDIIPASLLLILPLVLFRESVTGAGVWIGNPDRLNSNFKSVLYYVREFSRDHMSAWAEHEMLGFDALSLPFTYPNPLIWIYGLFDPQSLWVVAGWIVIGLLVVAGLAAYLFLRVIKIAAMEAAIGAACYQLSSLTILKVSQNEMSFAVFIVIPIALTLIYKITIGNRVWIFLGLTVLTAAMLHFMFLQKVAYAMLLMFAYATWRSIGVRRWLPLLLLAGAVLIGTVLAAPRLIEVAMVFGEYVRETAWHKMDSFASIYEFQGIRPWDLLRWFDATIFGISPSDAVRLRHNINLTEGFLLSTSPLVPLLLLSSIVRSRRSMLSGGQHSGFFLSALLFTIMVLALKPLYFVVYLLFLRIDFMHTRILIAGLLPICALVAIILTQWRPAVVGRQEIFGGVLAALLLAGAIEIVASFAGEGSVLGLRGDALIRILLTAIVLVTLIRLRSLHREAIAYAIIGPLIAVQAFLAADLQVNGPQTRTHDRPFNLGDMYMGLPGAFRVPSEQQLASLHALVGEDRVAWICPQAMAGGFCAGYLSVAWSLRTVDGYYGLGVPRRLRLLPWDTAASLRTISFTEPTSLPWSLLGFLNVSKAIVVNTELYLNRTRDGKEFPIRRLVMIENRERVVPRAFLSRAAVPVNNAAEAVQKIFSDGKVADVVQQSYVEGLQTAMDFDTWGPVAINGRGDRLDVDVSGSSGRRLLVLNELYFPGWRAFVDGREVPILPANSVMRAILLPPHAKHVTLTFEPFARTTQALYIYLCGLILLLGTALTLTLRR
ncbi:MAG TPA: hypothetical protein VNK48_17630 [Xanthobacteraceae bacterium]|nr:hypothetical protein [Xanthobacteraceae bacterium]